MIILPTMFDAGRLLVFFGAAVLLGVAPGPGMLYVLAGLLAGGRREGLLHEDQLVIVAVRVN